MKVTKDIFFAACDTAAYVLWQKDNPDMDAGEWVVMTDIFGHSACQGRNCECSDCTVNKYLDEASGLAMELFHARAEDEARDGD